RELEAREHHEELLGNRQEPRAPQARGVAVMRRDPVEHRHLRWRLSDEGDRDRHGEDHDREQHRAETGVEASGIAARRHHRPPPHGVIRSDRGVYRGPGALIVASRSRTVAASCAWPFTWSAY